MKKTFGISGFWLKQWRVDLCSWGVRLSILMIMSNQDSSNQPINGICKERSACLAVRLAQLSFNSNCGLISCQVQLQVPRLEADETTPSSAKAVALDFPSLKVTVWFEFVVLCLGLQVRAVLNQGKAPNSSMLIHQSRCNRDQLVQNIQIYEGKCWLDLWLLHGMIAQLIHLPLKYSWLEIQLPLQPFLSSCFCAETAWDQLSSANPVTIMTILYANISVS